VWHALRNLTSQKRNRFQFSVFFFFFLLTGELASDTSPQLASSPSLQISPAITAASANNNSLNGNLSNSELHNKISRAKRKPVHNQLQYSVDKMLNERNKLIVENTKKFLSSNSINNNGNLVSNNNNNNNHSASNLFSEKLKSDSNMNFIKNGQLSPTTAHKLSQITLTKCLNGTASNNNNIHHNNGNKLNGSAAVKTERLSPPLVNDLSMYRWVLLFLFDLWCVLWATSS